VKKKNIYIYPLSSKDDRLGLYNPYIDDLIESLESNFNFVNKDKPSGKGILDIIKYLPKLHFIHFNWIEKVHSNRFGKLQYRFMFILIPLLKIMGVKIIWTMHNKLSHGEGDDPKTLALFNLMLRKSHLILTHASAGIDFGESLLPGVKRRMIYLPHPVKDRRLKSELQKKYDVLIWGTISPYKGIDQFLQELSTNNKLKQFKMLIKGKASDKAYFNKLEKFKNEKIEIRNEFINDDDLAHMIAESKTVLFTYSKDSILSSGVLMDSLGFGANIIGPHVGAFADLAEDGIIHTFKDLSESISLIEEECSQPVNDASAALDKFLAANSWSAFGKNFGEILKKRVR